MYIKYYTLYGLFSFASWLSLGIEVVALHWRTGTWKLKVFYTKDQEFGNLRFTTLKKLHCLYCCFVSFCWRVKPLVKPIFCLNTLFCCYLFSMFDTGRGLICIHSDSLTWEEMVGIGLLRQSENIHNKSGFVKVVFGSGSTRKPILSLFWF